MAYATRHLKTESSFADPFICAAMIGRRGQRYNMSMTIINRFASVSSVKLVALDEIDVRIHSSVPKTPRFRNIERVHELTIGRHVD